MNRVRSFLSLANSNLLFLLSVFLLDFIPLFPKIPLFDALPGYIVKVRPEDFLVGLTALVWLRDAWRKRIQWNTSYFWFVCLYGIAGLASVILGIFLLDTVPFNLLHIGKSGLNLARYLEYFTLFFFLFSAIKTRKQVLISLIVIVLTLVGVVVYGVGQKYAHLPVYSTMNREYSKGEKLYLQEGARPQSTFAGHYDLAAYLVIILPLLFSLSLGGIKTKSRSTTISVFVGLQIVHAMGLVMLVLTGSKTSIIGYALGMGIVMLLQLLRLPTRKQQLLGSSIIIGVGVVGMVLGWVLLPISLKSKVTSLIQKIQTPSDTPIDLVGTGYEPKTVATTLADGTASTEVVMQKETWSANALKYGLSMGIRLDTLWPQALLGLARNPLTGAAYGTLSALDSHAFAEADSTDNNFLRTLGETGIVGFVIFYGIVLFVLRDVFVQRKNKDALESTLAIGLCGSIIGLLLSAFYLDVFASSKVAFTFWAVSALVLKAGYLSSPRTLTKEFLLSPIRKIVKHLHHHWPIYIVLLFSFFLLHQNPYMVHSQTKNIEDLTDSLRQLTHARCLLAEKSIGICRVMGVVGPLEIFYYIDLLVIGTVFVLTYLRFHTKASASIMFSGLLICLGIASLLRLTLAPFTVLAAIFVVIGFPGIMLLVIELSKRMKSQTLKIFYGSVLSLFGLLCLSSLLSHDLILRFQNIAPTQAFDAVELANGNVIPTPGKLAYLITAMNPYYSDLYTQGHYIALPLSSAQPYGKQLQKTWGIPNATDLATLAESLFPNAHVFMTNYGIGKNIKYVQSFDTLKYSYDVHYVALGCDEMCNIYSLHTATPTASLNPVSPFNGKSVVMNTLPSQYQFAVISNRFDMNLSPTAFSADTENFISKLNTLKKNPYQFAIITGDVIPNIDPFHANTFLSGAAAKIPYPFLYSAGNNDLFTKKYFNGEFQTFFTKTEFYILMNTDSHSQIDTDQQLALYDSFLTLEKLPNIKSVFVISQDLNWQDKSDPKNAINLVEKKLQAFKGIHTYVITAEHDKNLASATSWITTQENKEKTITYVGSLTDETSKDVFLQISINPVGLVTLEPQPFLK